MKTKRLISAVLAVTILFLTACRTAFPSAEEEPVPPPQDTAEYITGDYELYPEEFEPVSLEDFVAYTLETRSGRIRGLSMAVFTRDDIIFELQYGYADTEAGIAIDSDTVFQWASVAKLLVYVSAMQLYERGKLNFHADIFTYIPAGNFPNIRYPVTMHRLINHTAGLSDSAVPSYLSAAVPTGEDVPALGDYLSSVFRGAEIQTSRPGTRVEFSNYGIALAGYVIERISGIPFYEYVHENIFAPLGMYHTALRPDLSDNPWVNRQRDVIRTYDQSGLIHAHRIQFAGYPTAMATGTISDMIKFARALMPDQNGASILFECPQTLLKLFPAHEEIADIEEDTITGVRFFNGFIVFPAGGESARVLGHLGGFRGFASRLLVDIDNGIGIVMSENKDWGLLTVGAFTTGLNELVFVG